MNKTPGSAQSQVALMISSHKATAFISLYTLPLNFNLKGRSAITQDMNSSVIPIDILKLVKEIESRLARINSSISG